MDTSTNSLLPTGNKPAVQHQTPSTFPRKLKFALLIIGLGMVCAGSIGAIVLGSAGLAHVSLQSLGKLGAAIGTLGTFPHHLGLCGIMAAGLVGGVVVALGSAKIHYALQPQLTQELKKVFAGDTPHLNNAKTPLKKGYYKYAYGIGWAYILLRTNSFTGAMKCTGNLTRQQIGELCDKLQHIGFLEHTLATDSSSSLDGGETKNW